MNVWDWVPRQVDWALIACILTALTSIPLALRIVPPNCVYGFRTRYTRSNPKIWYDANAFVGRGMIAASLVSATFLLGDPLPLGGWFPAGVVLVPIFVVTLAGFVYLRHLRETAERR